MTPATSGRRHLCCCVSSVVSHQPRFFLLIRVQHMLASTTKVQFAIYSDSQCSNSSLLAVRRQLANNACIGSATALEGAKMMCSGFSNTVVQPSFPPAGFAYTSECTGKVCGVTETCNDVALPANKCVGLRDRALPTTRSSMILCDGGGTATSFGYTDGVCSQSAMYGSITQPSGACKIDRTVVCPATTQPLPTPANCTHCCNSHAYIIRCLLHASL